MKEFIDHDILKPPTYDAKDLAEWKKCVARDRRIILEGVRDHIVLKLHGKETPFAMWKTLNELFDNRNEAKKLKLMKKLRIEDKGMRWSSEMGRPTSSILIHANSNNFLSGSRAFIH